MDNLQWFKFSPADWMMGRIQRQTPQVQVDFLRLCCKYWQKDGDLSIEDAEIEAMDSYDVLVKYKIIKEENDVITIAFLDEQFDSVEDKRKQASKAGKMSAEARRLKKELNYRSTTVQRNPTPVEISSTELNRVEKSREEETRVEKSRKEKRVSAKDRIPTLESFIAYGLEQASKNKLNVSTTALSMKYEAWKVAGWINGNGQEVKNWKSSLLNTLPHIQETEKGKPKEFETPKDREAREIMEEIKRQAQNEILYGTSEQPQEPKKLK
jgi:hypothetical protein